MDPLFEFKNQQKQTLIEKTYNKTQCINIIHMSKILKNWYKSKRIPIIRSTKCFVRVKL